MALRTKPNLWKQSQTLECPWTEKRKETQMDCRGFLRRIKQKTNVKVRINNVDNAIFHVIIHIS